MKIKFIIIGMLFIILHIQLLDGSDMVTEIKNAYRNITDIRGRFQQKSILVDLGKSETYEGEFFIKIPSKFRWSYKGKAPQEVIVSGATIIIYQKKEGHVLKGRFDPSRYGQAPIALLGGLGNIKEVFEFIQKDNIIILKPKKAMGNIKTIELFYESKDFPIKKLKLTDNAMNTIEIILKDVKVNSGLSDSLFEFIPPRGVEVIEGLY